MRVHIDTCFWRAFITFALAMVSSVVVAAALQFPALTGRVVDAAQILSPSTIQSITAASEQHEAKTRQQIVVVTVPSLQETAIEDFGYQLGRHWGIGQKDENNGALLIVAPNEREVRIEVGYGLEGVLTDAASKFIIEQMILPEFRRGDYNAGVMQGFTGILELLNGDAKLSGEVERYAKRASNDAPESWMPIFIGILIVGQVLGAIVGSRIISGAVMSVIGFGVGWFVFSSFLLAFGVAFLILVFHLVFSFGGRGGGWGGGHFRSGGFGGGGGFSGGGGSFGGGGASGRW